jgi:single-stranded-DNA-specific exonuclease
MRPVFMAEGVRDNGEGRCVGEDGDHLRIMAGQGDIGPIVGIGFGLGDKLDIIKEGEPFKIAYALDENHWNGTTSLQLLVKDIKR